MARHLLRGHLNFCLVGLPYQSLGTQFLCIPRVVGTVPARPDALEIKKVYYGSRFESASMSVIGRSALDDDNGVLKAK